MQENAEKFTQKHEEGLHKRVVEIGLGRFRYDNIQWVEIWCNWRHVLNFQAYCVDGP